MVRKYNPKNTTAQHRTCFNARDVHKDVLFESLRYLGKVVDDKLLKKQLVTEFIIRIQALLPDTCGLCDHEYCVDKAASPMLTCIVCGQGSHDECRAALALELALE